MIKNKIYRLSQLFPVLCVIIFYEKIFSWFFVWVNFGTPKQYSALKQEENQMFL